MKKILIALVGIASIGFTSCNDAASKIKDGEVNAEIVTGNGTPAFSFVTENHDFGVIDEGTIAEYDFEFTNTGDAPLIISNAQGSCGCTVPNPPKEPIAPGEVGKIHVKFDSNGKPGNQNKTVTLNANTVPATRVLRISAQVTPKNKPAAAQEGGAPTEG